MIRIFQFGGSEAIITALSDEFPIIGRNREIFVACLFSLYFLVGLASCSQGGFYFFQLLDRYAAGYSILIAVFFEAIVVSWIYGEIPSINCLTVSLGITPKPGTQKNAFLNNFLNCKTITGFDLYFARMCAWLKSVHSTSHLSGPGHIDVESCQKRR